MSEAPRLSVSLTFDFDAMSVWIGSHNSNNPAQISRGEFGAVAVPRILDLLERHKIATTFFIPGHTALAYPGLVRDIRDRGHEIGHHGWVHENPAHFDLDGEREVFRRGLEALQEVAGIVPPGYRSPSVDFSPNTIDILLENGIAYDSSCSAPTSRRTTCGRATSGRTTRLTCSAFDRHRRDPVLLGAQRLRSFRVRCRLYGGSEHGHPRSTRSGRASSTTRTRMPGWDLRHRAASAVDRARASAASWWSS